ncbi:MAG: 4-hydroxy-4-methyl-2-oxoglutarate aldolase [Kribbellaceae bacterium]|nr:4-hydroxy-4-methyl-2-oxoglutarate aldolase [Kribbellaceae bacterium]
MQLLLDAGTAVIADIFDSNGIEPPVLSENLFAIQPATRFAGPAYTILGASVTFHEAGDREKLAAIDGMGHGVVPVWAGSDIHGVCCFGDLLGEAMKIRGCEGVVVDGGIRDVAYLRELELPVVARYRTPAQAIGRWKVTAHQVPVQVRGALTEWVTVNPGDLVVADEDGVLAVPAADADSVAEEASQWAGAESEARDAIRQGMSLVAALDRYGHL